MTFTRTPSATAPAGWKTSKATRMKRIAPLAAALLLLSLVTFALAPSDVADAAERGDTAVVKKLIAQHADVNAPQGDGATALHWAVYRSDKELVELLLR